MGDLSTTWAGLTLGGGLTPAWSGLTLGGLSTAWRTAWESGTRDPDEFALSLTVRQVTRDTRAGTLRLVARSDEMLAQLARVALTRPAEDLATRARVLLSAAGIDADLSALTEAAFRPVPAAALTWGASVWDHLAEVAALAGIRLAHDGRAWTETIIAPGESIPTPPEVTLTEAVDVVDVTDVDSGWGDMLALTLTWTTTAGDQVTETRTYPAAPPAGLHAGAAVAETSTIDADTWPGPTGEYLRARWAQFNRAGRVIKATAPADPTIRPGTTAHLTAPSYSTLTGTITAVTWDIPADTMTMTIEGIA